mgnify:CR=1 FL=1
MCEVLMFLADLISIISKRLKEFPFNPHNLYTELYKIISAILSYKESLNNKNVIYFDV